MGLCKRLLNAEVGAVDPEIYNVDLDSVVAALNAETAVQPLYDSREPFWLPAFAL